MAQRSYYLLCSGRASDTHSRKRCKILATLNAKLLQQKIMYFFLVET